MNPGDEWSASRLSDKFADVDRRFTCVQQSIDRVEATSHRLSAEVDTRLRDHIRQQVGQIEAALDSARRETKFAHDASEKAIAKAEVANEKRFESMNEFRGQLSDQAAGFIPREVHEQAIKMLSDRIHALELSRAQGGGEQDTRRRQQERLQPWMLWAAGAAMSIFLAVLIFAANLLTAA